MKKFIFASLVFIGLTACQPSSKEQQETTAENTKTEQVQIIYKDFGSDPLVINIEDYTLNNEVFRRAIWTGENLQLTVMTIPVGQEVGLEMHTDIDQFLRIEEGDAEVLFGDTKEDLNFVQKAGDDDGIFIPAGKWHNVINKGDKPLKLYSIYAKPEHPFGTIHHDKAESDAAHHEHEHE